MMKPLPSKFLPIYEGKSLKEEEFYNNVFTRVLTKIVCVLFFDIVPLLRNTLGPPVYKLAEALKKKAFWCGL